MSPVMINPAKFCYIPITGLIVGLHQILVPKHDLDKVLAYLICENSAPAILLYLNADYRNGSRPFITIPFSRIRKVKVRL